MTDCSTGKKAYIMCLKNMLTNTANINLIVTSALVLVVLWQFYKIQRLDSVRKHFYSSGLKKNLEQVLAEHDSGITKLNSEITDLNQQTTEIRKRNEINFQKIGFVRFSQFGEAGNLSFAMVVLDANNNGIAISSLHGRDGCRVYAKDIKNGKSKAKFTEEEQAALKQATNGEIANHK
jgi:hypothetical protein